MTIALVLGGAAVGRNFRDNKACERFDGGRPFNFDPSRREHKKEEFAALNEDREPRGTDPHVRQCAGTTQTSPMSAFGT